MFRAWTRAGDGRQQTNNTNTHNANTNNKSYQKDSARIDVNVFAITVRRSNISLMTESDTNNNNGNNGDDDDNTNNENKTIANGHLQFEAQL